MILEMFIDFRVPLLNFQICHLGLLENDCAKSDLLQDRQLRPRSHMSTGDLGQSQEARPDFTNVFVFYIYIYIYSLQLIKMSHVNIWIHAANCEISEIASETDCRSNGMHIQIQNMCEI